MKKVYIPMYIYENDDTMPSANAGRTTIASDNIEIWDDNYATWNDGFGILSVPNNDIIEDYEVTSNLAQIETFNSIMKRLCNSTPRQLYSIFGANTVIEVITLYNYGEIVKNFDEFDNAPKVGQIWKNPITGTKAIIVGVEDSYISLILGSSDDSENGNTISEIIFTRENFHETYFNTGETSKYYKFLVNEIK